jgi:site-specific recombinase XerD
MFLSTGCRISELHNAKLSSINDREILVIGKGKKERKVFITDVALHYLNIYVSKRKFESEYIFSQKYSGKALGMRAMHKVIQDVSERSNVRAFTHILRHSMATFLVSSGCPLYSIQEMLGHTDPKTTTIYAKNNSEMVKLEHLKYCNV